VTAGKGRYFAKTTCYACAERDNLLITPSILSTSPRCALTWKARRWRSQFLFRHVRDLRLSRSWSPQGRRRGADHDKETKAWRQQRAQVFIEEEEAMKQQERKRREHLEADVCVTLQLFPWSFFVLLSRMTFRTLLCDRSVSTAGNHLLFLPIVNAPHAVQLQRRTAMIFKPIERGYCHVLDCSPLELVSPVVLVSR